jgi:hypothetical protein
VPGLYKQVIPEVMLDTSHNDTRVPDPAQYKDAKHAWICALTCVARPTRHNVGWEGGFMGQIVA